MSKTPRTDKATFVANFGGTVREIVATDFAQRLELENRDLRALLDIASQALAYFVDLRGLTAAELKSAHNEMVMDNQIDDEWSEQ